MINVVFKDWAKQLNSREVSESTKSVILYYMYKEHQKLEPQTKEYFDLLTEIETTIEDLLAYKLPFVNTIDTVEMPKPPNLSSEQVQMLSKNFVSLNLINECIERVQSAKSKDELREILTHYKEIIDKEQEACIQVAQQEIGLLDDYDRYKISTFKVI